MLAKDLPAPSEHRLVPWQYAVRVAEEARNARLWMFDEGNHVCMNLTYRWRPQAADWLAQRLREAGSPRPEPTQPRQGSVSSTATLPPLGAPNDPSAPIRLGAQMRSI